MSEHFFGVSKRCPPSKADARRIDRIAKAHGVEFVQANIPGTGYQQWFAGPNRGSPFDRRMENAVYADLGRAGLLDADGRVRCKARSRR